MKLSTKNRKKFRIRNKLKKVSSTNRYRLTIFRSLNNISAQIIDDNSHKTLVSATSNMKSISLIMVSLIIPKKLGPIIIPTTINPVTSGKPNFLRYELK